MKVEVRNNDVAAALRKLKKKVFAEKILIEYGQHCFYEKPSDKKRRKRAESLHRSKREKIKAKLEE